MLFSTKITQLFCFWAFETWRVPSAFRISLNLRASIAKAFIKHFQKAEIHESGPSWMFCPLWGAGSGSSQPREQDAKPPDVLQLWQRLSFSRACFPSVLAYNRFANTPQRPSHIPRVRRRFLPLLSSAGGRAEDHNTNQVLPSSFTFNAILSVKSFFDTLPNGDNGKSSMISKRSGNLCFAISSLMRNATSCAKVRALPRRRMTQAHM